MTNPSFRPLLRKIDDEYYYWQNMKHIDIPEHIRAEDLWAVVKIQRRSTQNTLTFGDYFFNWNTNSKLTELLHNIDMNFGGSLESPYKIPIEDKSRYMISALMEEAIASSQIEGAVTTRKKAKEMLRKKIRPRDKSEQMIFNNYITIQKILEIKSEPLNKENLLALHKLVTSNTMSNPAEEGAFRDGDDIHVIDRTTGRTIHHPPDRKVLMYCWKTCSIFSTMIMKAPLFIH